jgi:hypothetical protein
MRKIFTLLALIGIGCTLALAQTQPVTQSITATAQCVSIRAQNNSALAVIVSGTWSGTLTPNVQISTASGAPTIAKKVVPVDSTTAQATITANGGYLANVAGFTQFNVCSTGTWTSGTAIVTLYSTPAPNNSTIAVSGGGGGSTAWSALTNPTGNLSLATGTDTTTFASSDFGASSTGPIWTMTGPATSNATDASVELEIVEPAGSYHHPFSSFVDGGPGTGFAQFSICNNGASHIGTLISGNAPSPNNNLVPCSYVNQSTISKVWMLANSVAHTNLTLFQSGSPATGTMFRLNNATAAGTGFNFLTACTSANSDGSCSSPLLTIDGQGDITTSGALSIASLTCSGSPCPAVTAANIGTILNIAQYASIYSGGTSAAPLGTAAPTVNGDWMHGYHITGSATSAPVNEELVASTTNSDGLTVTPTYNATGPTQRFEITGNYSGSLASATALPAAQVSSGQLGSGVQNSASLNLTGTVASGTAAMGTSAISSGSCATVVTVSASGVATTDVVKAGFNGDPTAVTGYGSSASGAVLTIYPYPTSGNVNFKVCNSTASSITPGALTLNWFVQR